MDHEKKYNRDKPFMNPEISTIKKKSCSTIPVRKTRPFLATFKQKNIEDSVISQTKESEWSTSSIPSPKLDLSLNNPTEANDDADTSDGFVYDETLDPKTGSMSTLAKTCELPEQPPNPSKNGGNSSDDDIMITYVDEGSIPMPKQEAGEKYTTKKHEETTSSNIRLCRYKIYEIFDRDYKTLEDGEFLNDNIIDFYLSHVYEEVLDDVNKEHVYIYPTQFYKRLSENKSPEKLGGKTKEEEAYIRVKNWTRKIEIFEKRLLIFPICENEHWYLVIICNPGLVKNVKERKSSSMTPDRYKENKSPSPYIIVLDSLGGAQRDAVKRIRKYLQFEHLKVDPEGLSFGQENLKWNNPVVPHQPNSCDCGIYLLHYVEKILGDISQLVQKNLPNLAYWFKPQEIDNKREVIALLIQSIANQHSSESIEFPKLRFRGIESKWSTGRYRRRRNKSEPEKIYQTRKKKHEENFQSKSLLCELADFQEYQPQVGRKVVFLEDNTKGNSTIRNSKGKDDGISCSHTGVCSCSRLFADMNKDASGASYKIPKIKSKNILASSGYDTSDNQNYFIPKQEKGIVERIDDAFENEHSDKINNSNDMTKMKKKATKLKNGLRFATDDSGCNQIPTKLNKVTENFSEINDMNIDNISCGKAITIAKPDDMNPTDNTRKFLLASKKSIKFWNDIDPQNLSIPEVVHQSEEFFFD